jgi:uncharacterized protein
VSLAPDPWTLRERLRNDLQVALKSGRRESVSTLRTMIAAVDDAEAVALDAAAVGVTEVPRRELSASDLDAIVRIVLREFLTQSEHYRTLGRHDAAERLARQAATVRGYLDASPPDDG